MRNSKGCMGTFMSTRNCPIHMFIGPISIIAIFIDKFAAGSVAAGSLSQGQRSTMYKVENRVPTRAGRPDGRTPVMPAPKAINEVKN